MMFQVKTYETRNATKRDPQVYIQDEQGYNVARLDVAGRAPGSDPLANAALIVAAVNAHEALVGAVEGLLDEPYGCTLCDAGRPRNPEKGHQPDCAYEAARAALAAVKVP